MNFTQNYGVSNSHKITLKKQWSFCFSVLSLLGKKSTLLQQLFKPKLDLLECAGVMPRQQASLSELGSIYPHNEEFRAHVNFLDQTGHQKNICGPSRKTEEQAQKDLEEIRKAGEKGKTREEGLQFMRDEAQKLKDSAQYEAEIRETLRRLDSVEEESDYDYYDDMSDNSEPPWIQEYPEEPPEEPPEQSSQSVRPTLSSIEATAELSRFRPIKTTPSDLKYLLESRADPNLPLKAGDITPLRNVLSFARENHVAEMRDLLLQHGANEDDADIARWELRRRADFCERIRLSNYNNIDKDYDPLSGSVEY